MTERAQQTWIASMGMTTAVGDCVQQTAASVRAGISRYAQSSMCNKHYRPMTAALVPDSVLPPLNAHLANTPGWSSRVMRMIRLGHAALVETLSAITLPARVPLFLACPETLPTQHEPSPGIERLIDGLIFQTDAPIDRDRSIALPTGRAGGLQALQAAMSYMAQTQSDYALIGGVDTFLDLSLLGVLDQEDRILAEGTMDGFAPGEGAAFLLLCSERVAQRAPNAVLGTVHAPCIAAETGHRYSHEPYRGDGLATAVRGAIDNAGARNIATVLSSLNGEHFGAKEWGVAATRSSHAFAPELRMVHPADCFGDIGAACAPALIALAATGLKRGYYRDPALVWCASDLAPRGAACISP